MASTFISPRQLDPVFFFSALAPHLQFTLDSSLNFLLTQRQEHDDLVDASDKLVALQMLLELGANRAREALNKLDVHFGSSLFLRLPYRVAKHRRSILDLVSCNVVRHNENGIFAVDHSIL